MESASTWRDGPFVASATEVQEIPKLERKIIMTNDDFVITGNKTEQTKQIGNSVPVRTARALVRTLLERYAK